MYLLNFTFYWYVNVIFVDCLLPMQTVSVGMVECLVPSVCLFVCLQHNSKTNYPKVFTLGIGNDLGISYKWYGFGVERSRSVLRLGWLTAIRHGFEL